LVEKHFSHPLVPELSDFHLKRKGLLGYNVVVKKGKLQYHLNLHRHPMGDDQ